MHPDNNIPANPYQTPPHIVPEYFDCSLMYGNIFMKNPTRCGKTLMTKEITSSLTVKRFFLNGQSAREGLDSTKNLARTSDGWHMPSLQRLNVGHPDGFVDWLVGLIDGDGFFYFNKTKKGTWVFSFKITQSNYNLKLLSYLKKKLHCGSVKPSGKNSSQYYLRNPKLLHFFCNNILPDNPFFTFKKAWQFLWFKKALDVYQRAQMKEISVHQRDVLLDEIKLKKSICVLLKKKLSKKESPSIGWLIGFSEAEGSFYLSLKKENLLVHAISWAQKDDKQLLETIRYKLNIQAKVSEFRKKDFVCYKLVTHSAKTIEKIIPLFEGKMKGMKGVEVRKWARSFRKYSGNFEALFKLRHQLRIAKKHSS